MSLAWRQLQSAIRTLAAIGDRRDRLHAALNKLIKLKTRDLPSEVADDFTALLGGIARYPAKNIPHELRSEVNRLSDAEVMEGIRKIMRMYDAVAAYQPRPMKHNGGPRKQSAPVPSWPITALHFLETRQGAFSHENA